MRSCAIGYGAWAVNGYPEHLTYGRHSALSYSFCLICVHLCSSVANNCGDGHLEGILSYLCLSVFICG
jgi:hypothetical protein